MIKHGIDSMPGGGAEILMKSKKKICGGKSYIRTMVRNSQTLA